MDTKNIYTSRPWCRLYPEDAPRSIELPQASLPDLFDKMAERYSNHIAVYFYGSKMKYGELKRQVHRLAASMHQLGVKKGDRVALYLLNSPQFIISYLAILKLGAVVTPISPVYTSQEVRHQLADSGARVVICQDILYDNVIKTEMEMEAIIVTGIADYLPPLKKALGRSLLSKVARDIEIPDIKIAYGEGVYRFKDLVGREGAPPPVKIDPQRDLAVLPYTGGTTGPPKGVLLTHYNVIATQQQTTCLWPILKEGAEVIIAFLPFYHIYGQIVAMINGFMLGAEIVLFTTPDFDDIIYAIDSRRATLLYGVPTFFEYLKEYDKTDRANWRRLKLITCGADTLHENTVISWQERTGTKIMEGYGMTETAGVSHATPLGLNKIGSFGLPIPNVDAAIVDPETNEFLPPGEVGEMILSGPNITAGYWNNPAETERTVIELEGQSWLKTGDLVRMSEDGYFYFYDRKRDLIKYKGYSIFARDIEDYLYQHPQVKAAGVIGVPDRRVGQLIKAIVVLQNEARGKVSEEDLKEYCKQGLAYYKVPKIIEFRGELPQTDVGKISRRELREELEEVE
ncbi:MAG TPA: AMP-binding protein [Bacillota bacterium]|nr:AMP-binding protein [Bacillota bacterium]HOL15589.1 AMP-binding protein [Bacillota bacterium]